MTFEDCLLTQIALHPSMQAQDLIKHCYQAAFGAEHLLSDVGKAREYFTAEYNAVQSDNKALYEPISPDVCRINLSAWKAHGMPSDWLFRMFVISASFWRDSSKAKLLRYLDATQVLVEQGALPLSVNEWYRFRSGYEECNMPAVHHSTCYREREQPAYRIISSRFVSLLPFFEKCAKSPEQAVYVNAIFELLESIIQYH